MRHKGVRIITLVCERPPPALPGFGLGCRRLLQCLCDPTPCVNVNGCYMHVSVLTRPTATDLDSEQGSLERWTHRAGLMSP